MEESAGGEEPPAFSVDEADARDEDSDDYSGLFDESETAEQEEEISWDTLGLETWVHTYARAILKTCFIYLPIMILHKTRCKIRL